MALSDKTLFSNAGKPFYDSWEGLPALEKNKAIRTKFSAIIEHAAQNVPFYKSRLKNFRADAAQPLKDVETLTAQDLRENLPPTSKSLLSVDTTSYTVFQSGGTTGVPKTSLFTHEDMELINACNARGFFATGLKPTDKVANLWAVGGLYMTFIHMNRVFQEYGCTSFPFSNQTPTEFINTVHSLFNMNCYSGISSVVLKTLREIRTKYNPEIKIEKVYFGGEHLYPSDVKELRDQFGAQIIAAPGYGTVDSWYIGYQCNHTPLGVFHTFDDMVHVEILDENMNHCIDDTGILHVTCFVRKLTPIIRYKVGDKARWIKEPCACGRTSPLFQLYGRGDDVLRIGYDSIDYAAVQHVAQKHTQLSGNIQMEKKRKEGKDLLVIRIEAQELLPKEKYTHVAKQFEQDLLHDRPSLSDFVKKGTIWPLEVEILGPAQLPLNPRTGKLIRVIDAI